MIREKQREYAEYIQLRLKELGLTVDLLLPSKGATISQLVADISDRGILYAIFVFPHNEECRSLSLFNLHGSPKVHQHLQLEEAFPLIVNNFEAYKRGEELPRAVVRPMVESHPEAIQGLSNLLADYWQLTAEFERELEDAKRYLELGDSKDLPPSRTRRGDTRRF